MRIHLEVGVAADGLRLGPLSDSLMGGTERLAVRLATGLVTSAHAVTFRGGGWRGEHAGVTFLGDGDRVPSPDRLVCVNAPPPPDVTAQHRIYWSHTAQLPLTADWSAIVAVSGYHAGLLRARLPGSRVVALPTGPAAPSSKPQAAPDRFLCGSTPDSGLHHLLQIWPTLWVRFRRPLSITDDLRGVIACRAGSDNPLGARLRRIASMLDQPGIVVHGALSRAQLAEVRARSIALLWPFDSLFSDPGLDSTTVLDTFAAGAPCLISPGGWPLHELEGAARFVVGVNAEVWADAIEDVIVRREEWAGKARLHAARQTWEAWDAGWRDLLEHLAPAGGVGPIAESAATAAAAPSGSTEPRPWRPPELRS